MLLSRSVLCLNASYEPIRVCSARRALILVHKGAAVVEAVSKHKVHTSRIDIPIPDVIRMVHYRKIPRQNRKFSRKGILLRDSFTCQYCSKKLAAGDLTLDHVMPRSRGGHSVWENLVACCFPCNNKKGDRTPQEANLALLRPPRPITIHSKLRLLSGDEAVWDRYLFC